MSEDEIAALVTQLRRLPEGVGWEVSRRLDGRGIAALWTNYIDEADYYADTPSAALRAALDAAGVAP